MPSTHVIHITPELPPKVGGIADYTAILSRRLVEQSNGEIEPILVHAGAQKAETIEVDFPVVNLKGECSASSLATTIDQLEEETNGQTVVLLEYSGYGYAKRGAPLWLVRGLERVCGNSDGPPLVTMFHEISASGPIWTSAFWLSFVQEQLVCQLARRSDRVLTNRPDTAEWLRERTSTPVRFSPVFSNVGEPDDIHPFDEREPYAVVFGGTGKKALYTEYGDLMAQCLEKAGISRVVDVGPCPPVRTEQQSNVQLDVRGLIDQKTVSQCLRNAQMGLLCRNPAALTKSGVLAAYLAHGTPTVIALRGDARANPTLLENRHYVSLGTVSEDTSVWEKKDWISLGRRGHEWYLENAHSRRAAQNALELIQSVSPTHV